MKIGILQTGHAPDPMRPKTGDYSDLFQKLLAGHGFTFDIYNVVDGAFPAGPRAADGWLITGSRHGVYEPHPWIPPLEQLIRDIRAQGVPLVGICFGHQIVAQALGGKVEKFSGGWNAGPVEYRLEGFPEPVRLMAWHQDQVVAPPPGARPLGSGETCQYAMLGYDDDILTIQPHPEFDAGFIRGLIDTRGGSLPPEVLARAARDLDKPTASGAMAERIASFFLKSRQTS